MPQSGIRLFLIQTCLGLVALTSTVSAQGPFVGQLPDAEAGVQYEYSLLPDLNDIPFTKDLLTTYNATFTGSGTGDVPGLTITGGTRVSGVPTRPGSYRIQLVLIFTYVVDRETRTFPGVFNSSLLVRSPTSTALTIEGGTRSFDFSEGDTIPQTRTIRLTNRGQLTRVVSATVSSQPRGWLTAGSTTSVAPYSTTAIPVTANPAGFRAGVYTGSIEVTASGGSERFTVLVILTVSPAGPAISVSQTGLTFEVQQGSTARLSQSFQVTGSSRTPIPFSNIASVLGAGSWLRVSPSEGNATSTAPSNVTASIVPDGLNPGAYYGQIEVRASAAGNSPRTVNVVLNVVPVATTVAPLVTPSAVVLVQRPGAPVASQTVAVTNVSRSTVPVSVGVAFEGNIAGWMAATASPFARPGETATIVVSRVAAVRLSPGVYRADMAVGLGDAQRRVAVVLVIPQAPGNNAAGANFNAAVSPRLEGCTPTKLVPVFKTLGSAFSVVAGWPSALEMLVVDDCGDPLLAGSTIVSFSDGTAPLVLSATGAGSWSGTWQPKQAIANLVLTATATSAATPQLTGAAQIGGSTTANPSAPPVIDSGGIVSAAASSPGSPLAPGGFISIYGAALATGLNVAQTLPFPTDLAGTQAFLGGKRLPMHFAADGQVNAIVPFDVPINTPQLMIVRRGNALSTPEQVVVAQAQPAVFATQTNEGRVTLVDGSVVSATNPATAGGALIIYCTGLGPVSESVPAGTPAPTNRLVTTTNPVTVTVGGRAAQVLFAGLAPSFAGLYQVNVIVPAGVTPGAAVDLVLTVAGRSSNPVTVAIR